MLVGADVTHPSPGAGAERIPSIAAVSLFDHAVPE